MRFAPPKSAPPDSRKCSKDIEVSPRLDEARLSGWSSGPIQDDLTLLTQCAAALPRRCSSATQRHNGQLVVNFGRNNTYKHRRTLYSSSESNLDTINGSNKYSAESKDSGVDGLTETNSMDRIRLYDDEAEFSDISDSEDDENLDNEELMLLGESDTDDTSDILEPVLHQTSSLQTLPSDKTSIEEVNNVGMSRKELRNYLHMMGSNCNNTTVTTSNKKKSKNDVRREHQIPNPITPDIPESPAPTKTQLWSRSKKLERHSTSPSMCSYTDVIYDKTDDPFLSNTFENVLHANRPPYRNEKRRTSNVFKSSCSIPSFSKPNQALLLIGMQPANKPTDSNKAKTKVHQQRKAAFNSHKPPMVRVTKTLTHMSSRNGVIELPALSVNGEGDLVIRKKQIISG